jgi:hypothetical protein
MTLLVCATPETMPFTAAHPAAVLPFVAARRQLHLDTTCLVIGSMAPDFEYFVRGRLRSTISHTLAGLFAWDLPTTLLLCFAFHAVVKWPLLLTLPDRVARLVAPAWARPPVSRWTPAAIVSLIASSLIGAASHLVWDSFTHRAGYAVHRVAVLGAIVELPVFGRLPVYRLLQHVSTFFGLLLIAIYLARSIPSAALPLPPRDRAAPRLILATSILVGSAAMEARLRVLGVSSVGDAIVAAISGAFIGTFLGALILRRPAIRLREACRPLAE